LFQREPQEASGDRACGQAAASEEEDKTYTSLSEVPGTLNERHAVEDERFSASALFGLTCSDVGIRAILDAGPEVVDGADPFLPCLKCP
jgi:hypothetical protein